MLHTLAGMRVFAHAHGTRFARHLSGLSHSSAHRILYPGPYQHYVDFSKLEAQGFAPETHLGLGDTIWVVEDQDSAVMLFDQKQFPGLYSSEDGTTAFAVIAKHDAQLGPELGKTFGVTAECYDASCLIVLGSTMLDPDIHGQIAVNLLVVDATLFIPSWEDLREVDTSDFVAGWANEAVLAAIEEREWFRRHRESFREEDREGFSFSVHK